MAGGNGSLIFASVLAEIERASGGGSGNGSDIDSTVEDLDLLGIHADKILAEDGEPSSIRVPKYFQAIITLVVCGLLLLGTLGIIKQTKKLCKKSSCARNLPMIRVDSAKDGDNELNTIVVDDSSKRNENGDKPHPGDRHFDYYRSPSPAPKDPGSNQMELLQEKKVRFVRRASGPFSDDAIGYVGQSYKSTKESKYKPTNSQKSKELGPNRASTIRKPSPTPPSQ